MTTQSEHHAQPPAGSVAPIVREVLVRTDLETAFDLFTERIGSWWPLATHSVFGEHATVAFQDGRLVERAGRSDSTWGEVLAWDPPNGFRITWHPGHGNDQATEVEVRFAAEDDQVRVSLVHIGWERRADVDARASYETGWIVVLDRYAAAT
jgi:Activator of Hsp90 ATPase homolog 1-like protein